MHYKKTHEWVEVILWIGVVLTLLCMGCAIWNGYVELSIVSLVALFAFLLLLDYLEYCHVMRIRKRFVIAQESFTTLMLIYFSYAYFARKRQMPDNKAINNTRKKFDEVYDKSRYHLTAPLFAAAVKVMGKIKDIKNNIMDDLKELSSKEGFNLDNAENLTKAVGNLAENLDDLSDIVSKGFKSGKSMEEIIDDDQDEEDDDTSARRTSKTRSSSNTSNVRSRSEAGQRRRSSRK